jgi:hypothetical protein
MNGFLKPAKQQNRQKQKAIEVAYLFYLKRSKRAHLAPQFIYRVPPEMMEALVVLRPKKTECGHGYYGERWKRGECLEKYKNPSQNYRRH